MGIACSVGNICELLRVRRETSGKLAVHHEVCVQNVHTVNALPTVLLLCKAFRISNVLLKGARE